VQGTGNKTPNVAELFSQALIARGFIASDVEITPFGDTAYLIARWPGSDPALKPLVISGHMDVVEAKPADWQRDPFTPVVENGYLFGRGATDMKLDDAIAVQALGDLRAKGFRPRRTIVLALSGDEETAMKTGTVIAEKLKGADLVLNIDGGVGTLDEKTGAPDYFSWQAAEKSYADFELTVTNPGGHSSEPRTVNAIDELAAALLHIQPHRFTPELNPVSRAYFKAAARYASPETGAAMRTFAADPADPHAIATLAADPAMVGRIGTTCVVTMIEGGHAQNALPQRATANVNCRIFPGNGRAAIMRELQAVAADPAIGFHDISEGAVDTDASPLRPDFVRAVEDGIHAIHPGVAVFPSISSGASDCSWFRHEGVPCYIASAVFLKLSEDFSHGLNERTPIASIGPAITAETVMIEELAR
jgi:acetylornithine deacetylase/succinyl-diaminopimelate desuccinylase-like protein